MPRRAHAFHARQKQMAIVIKLELKLDIPSLH